MYSISCKVIGKLFISNIIIIIYYLSLCTHFHLFCPQIFFFFKVQYSNF